LLTLAGWRAALLQPVPLHCIVIVYPHPSNCDFPIGLAFKWMTGINFRFVAKDSLFKGPFDRLFRHWGGIPVKRREPAEMIGVAVKCLPRNVICGMSPPTWRICRRGDPLPATLA